MMKQVTTSLIAAAMLAGVPAVASADWSDDFESYPPGVKLDDRGGWFGWDDNSSWAGTVSSAQALSGTKSIAVSSSLGEDAVHPFTGYDSGLWELTAHQYIPSTLTGTTLFIVNNEYTHDSTAPRSWALTIEADSTLGEVYESQRDPDALSGVPIVYDQWVEIRVVADLDSNTSQMFYNDQLIASGDWNDGSGAIEIQNLDLYAPHSQAVYYDDISLELIPEPASALALLPLLALGRRRRN